MTLFLKSLCTNARTIVVLLLCALVSAGCCKPSFTWQRLPRKSLRSHAIPERYPLGSVVREHFHVMQTNAEASDFIFHQHEFVGNSAELTPDGKDHILEVAARMRSAPFPVLVERSENNSDPELDAHRRHLIAQILTDLGNPDAHQRTFVAPAYEHGMNSQEAEFDYYRFLWTRGFGGGFVGGGAGGFGAGGAGVGGAGAGGFGF